MARTLAALRDKFIGATGEFGRYQFVLLKDDYPMVDNTGCQKIYDTISIQNHLMSVGTGKFGQGSLIAMLS